MESAFDEAPERRLEAEADRYLRILTDDDRFSGAALVAKDGVPWFSRGYGHAQREHGIANTPRTKFRLGSITKQFTALAILHLEEHGPLNVRDPISRHLPGTPQHWADVTVHHLLNHTSGIPNYTQFIDWQRTARSPLPLSEIVSLFQDRPLDFTPGTRHSYSNSGYILLGQIIEHASGQTYEAFMQETIWTPLGMRDTGYDDSRKVLPNRASGYGRPVDEWVNADYLDMNVPHAAGSLYSTVENLLLWDGALYTDRIVAAEALRRMNAINPLVSNYGYGVQIGRHADRDTIEHGGGIHGFRTHLLRIPDERICVAVLSNLESTDPGRIARDLASMALGKPFEMPEDRQPIPVDPALYRRYAGDYEFAPSITLSIHTRDDRLLARLGPGAEVELHPTSETCFFRKATDQQVTFHPPAGDVTHLVLKQGSVERQARKV